MQSQEKSLSFAFCSWMLTLHARWFVSQNGLYSRTIRRVATRNCVEKAGHKIYLTHNWTNHLCIALHHGQTTTNRVNSRRVLPTADPAGKLNSCQSQQGKKWKHLFDGEKPSLLFIAPTSKTLTFQISVMQAASTLTCWGAPIVIFFFNQQTLD